MNITEYIVAMLTKFREKVQEKFYDKTEIDNKISTIDSSITTVNNEAVHDNRSTLDKLSEDVDGNLLYDIYELAKQTDFETFKTEVNDSISLIGNELITINDDLADMATEIVDIQSDAADLNNRIVDNTNAISDVNIDITNINDTIATMNDSTKISVNVTQSLDGTIVQKTLQEVIDMILAGGFTPSPTPTYSTVAEVGLAECGTAECGA